LYQYYLKNEGANSEMAKSENFTFCQFTESRLQRRDDYYAGQIDQAVKDIIDNKDREKSSAQGSWKDDKGHPIPIKRGLLVKEAVSSSLKMHCKRNAALMKMQMKAGDLPAAHHGQHFFMLVIRDNKI
jgi:hypothetical protein